MLYTRSNARASGRFWIDPATGAIHQTVQSRASYSNPTFAAIDLTKLR